MVKSDVEFAFDNFHVEVIPQTSMEKAKKLARLKRAIAEGTYQINSKKLANKLIKLIILAGDVESGSDISERMVNL